MTYLEEYHELIKTKQIIVGYWIKQEIQNLVDDLQDERFIYDTAEAHKRIKFMETLCLQSKAPYYMKPIKLMPWQKAWWEAVYSFRMRDTGLRRFTDGILEISRKNGKSTCFSADAMYDLFCGRGGEDIITASNDDRQCRIIWDEIAGMRTRLDPKKLITSQNLTKIRNIKKDISVCRVSARSKS